MYPVNDLRDDICCTAAREVGISFSGDTENRHLAEALHSTFIEMGIRKHSGQSPPVARENAVLDTADRPYFHECPLGNGWSMTTRKSRINEHLCNVMVYERNGAGGFGYVDVRLDDEPATEYGFFLLPPDGEVDPSWVYVKTEPGVGSANRQVVELSKRAIERMDGIVGQT